jgi:4-amino-4-deoxy-L-arabinose transferase-like glycosyltransferase
VQARREKAVVALALLLGAALRLLALGDLPRGFHPDEAVEAYEAWSLAQTGRSSDGRRLPLVFDNHGLGWAEGTYTWAAVPFVALSGDAVERGARLPAAIAGILAIAGTWRLARRLLGARAAAFAALAIAAEPIAVHFSRVALRATLEPALLAWGLALALEGLEREPRVEKDTRASLHVLAGGALLGLGVLTYPPARVVVPIVACALAGLVAAPRERRVALLTPVAAALLAITPFALSTRGVLRLREIAVTNVPGPHDGESWGPVLDAARGYVLHFSPRTLVVGDQSRGFWAHSVPALLWADAILLIIGVVALARRARASDRRALFALVLLAAAPLASAVTRPAPNLIRAIFLVPALALVVGAGGDALLAWIEARRPSGARAAVAVMAVAWLASLGGACWLYDARFPAETTAWTEWVGWKDRVAALSGDVRLTTDLERSLVDLYGRDRRRVWRSRTRGWIEPRR